jgi:diguanylate cyclase (GGDEF)-like protein/PAS domain S-box-containing protein
MKNSSVNVSAQDLGLRYTWEFNPQPEQSAHDVVGKTDYDILPRVSADRAVLLKRRAIAEARAVRDEIPVLIGGRTLYYEFSIDPVRDASGDVVGITSVVLDITERKLAEKALQKSNERLVQAQAVAHVGNWEIDVTDRSVWASAEALRIYGLDEASPFMPLDLILQIPIVEDRPRLDAALHALLESDAVYEIEFGIVRARDGESRIVHSKAYLVRGAGGVPAKIVGVIQDITERRQTEIALRESEERFRSLFEHSSDMVAVIDGEGVITFLCSSIERVLGFDPASVVGKSVFDLVHPNDRSIVTGGLRDALTVSGVVPSVEVRMLHRDGTWRHMEIVGNNQLERPEIRGVIINCRDITERRAIEAELRHQAVHDSLTGLPNRILFRDRVEHALLRAARHDRIAAVLFIDLDHFKVVNDSLGHQVGDRLLVEVAARIKSCLRAEDTAARLGGDEFTVLLEEIGGEADAALLAERILRRLGQPYVLEARETFVNASIGIVLSAGPQETADEMLRRADVAMYQAKAAGRGRYMLFRREMSLQAHERMDTETDLRRAIERGEFRIHYQPIISLGTSSVVGVEALARWEHPKYGLMDPDTFIPIQEQIGLMGPFTLWVLKEAQTQCLRWHRMGHHLSVSVNLSPVNLHEDQFVKSVADVLEETGFTPSWLKLEITESAVMINPSKALECLGRFDAMGIRLSMDDFGTGHSSLSYLNQMPVCEVKIDKSFAMAICGRDDDNVAILTAAIEMAHRLRKRVVTEGVETKAVWNLLARIGCDAAQGFYLARPMPTDEFAEWLETSRWSANGAALHAHR